MQNNYILINKNNEILSFYYGKERSIYCKKTKNNNYQTTDKIIQNVTDYFTVDVGPNKEIYVFCQNYNGDIILCVEEKDNFVQKILFKNKSGVAENIIFYPIFFKNNMSLIYNTPSYNNNFLSIRTLIDGKNWSNEENIDTLSILTNSIFDVQKINQDDIIIAYQKRNKDIQIGYKQITNGNISNFITIHRTGYQIVDYSFISFKNIIHYIYITKSLFSSQVIYRRKDESGISSPIVLFEGQKIKNCNINVLNNNLYCSFVTNSNLYYCMSDNFGISFSGVSKYRGALTQDIVKAKFITSNNIENSLINEVYIDSKNTLNIYMLPELLPSLFNINNSIINNKHNIQINEQEKFITNLNNQFVNNIENKNINNNINEPKNYNNISDKFANRVPLANDFMSNFNLEEFSKFNINKENMYAEKNSNINNNTYKNSILENKLKMLNSQLNEKNNQILKLNDIIQNKNNDQIEIENVLREKIKTLENENSTLLEKSKNLEKQLEDSKNINKPIEIEMEVVNNNDEIISISKKD
ncbi:hypothetical protein [uncultured Tyzzerella sp.]|uniref:hypothetical protein n=1 Tax=uncultured Tyzzerella sp. TaxID=2321398 RepID=UPI002942A500|nr:hypothetical protein [uncultured Tyzzerella sp.]